MPRTKNVFRFAKKESAERLEKEKMRKEPRSGEVYHPFTRVGCYIPGGSCTACLHRDYDLLTSAGRRLPGDRRLHAV